MKKTICLLFVICLITNGIVAGAAIEQPVSFLQYDEQWGSESYSIINDSSQTIGSSGCGPTTMAMVLNYYIDESITPVETAEFALKNHHRTTNDGTSWTYFNDIAEEYNLEFLQTHSAKEALEWMETETDPLIICSMGPGLWTTEGHFILVWDIEKENAYINDPNSEKEIRNKNSFNYLSRQCNQYFCFDKQLEINTDELLFQSYNYLSVCWINSLINDSLMSINKTESFPMISNRTI